MLVTAFWFIWKVTGLTMLSDVVQESWNSLLNARGRQWHVGCKLPSRQHKLRTPETCSYHKHLSCMHIIDLTWDLMQMNPESNKRLLHHVAMKMESRSCAHSMTMWSNMFFLVCEAFFELQWVFVGTVWDREFPSDGAIAASRGCQSASPDRRATRLNVYPGSAQLLKSKISDPQGYPDAGSKMVWVSL